LTEGLAQVGARGQVGRQVAYASDLGRLLGLGSERRGEEAQSEDSDDCDTSDQHAATAGCWLSIAAIFRQPSILRNVVFNDAAAHRVQFIVSRPRDDTAFFTYDHTTDSDPRPWQWRATYFRFPIAGRLPLGSYPLTLTVDGVPTGSYPFTIE
jgi:hypothetical protein